MRSIARRTAALVAVPALALTGLVTTSSPASAAADPKPAPDAASWLVAQLDNGIVHNDQYDFDDIGLSADIGFALATAGGHDATVADIAAAVAPRAQDEWYTSTYQGVTTLYAGSLAKAAAFAQAAGADPTDFGGQDLISRLEGTVSTTPPTTGRVQDENNDYGDTNVFGQAYAAEALATAGSPSAPSVTTFLLQQQCADGWFRLELADRTAPDQSCDGDPSSTPDTDATAIALAALVGMHDDALAPAIDRAEQWLLDTQKPNGAWGGGQTTEAANTNSTGLAGSVLGDLGDTGAAQDAAAWVRAHQAANVGSCTRFAATDLGTVAYDDAARTALIGSAIAADTADQFRRATAQALPVLRWAQSAGEPHALMSPEYVKGGSRAQVGVIGAAPGEALCARRLPGGADTLGWADRHGEGHLAVRVPNRTETTRVRVWNGDGAIGTVRINSLGRTHLRVTLKAKRVDAGHRQVVTVRHLAPGEQATVHVRWPNGRHSASASGSAGQANRHGVFRARFTVPHRFGTAKVKAFGQFHNRRGATSFVVIR